MPPWRSATDWSCMMQYVVEITETLQRHVVVEADDCNQAENIVRTLYGCGEILLDASNHVDTSFEVA